MSPAKAAEPIEMLFGLWARVDSRNRVLGAGPDTPCEEVKGRPIVKYSDSSVNCAKTGGVQTYSSGCANVPHESLWEGTFALPGG